MARRFGSLAERTRRAGFGGTLRLGLEKLLRRGASFHLLHAITLERDGARPPALDPEFELRFLAAGEVAALAADPAHPIGPEFVERARGGRDLCFGALHRGRLASSLWIALGSVEGAHAGGADLALPDHSAYLYKAFTHPDFRGRQLYPACMHGALTALAGRGVERVVAFVYWGNEAGLRSCRRAGGQRVGWLGVAPGGRIFAPADLRRLGIRFGREAGDALVVREGAPEA